VEAVGIGFRSVRLPVRRAYCRNEAVELRHALGLFQHVQQLSERTANPLEIDVPTVPDQQALDVAAIAKPPGHGLQHDEILDRRNRQHDALEVERRGSGKRLPFEGQPRQTEVEVHT